MPQRSVSVTKSVRASAEQIFALLTDPAKHPLIDGSGTVRAPLTGGPDRLTLGTAFGMDMKMGLRYRIENVVVEYEENKLIAWRHFNGHRWRWQLDELDETTTEVTETFDWSTARFPLLLDISRFPKRNKVAMEKSLDRISDLFTASI